MRPLVIDLFCGLGGWSEGFMAEGYGVVGFDIERHIYGKLRYPAQLVIQDVLTIHGAQFRNAACIVASPPCQNYSYMAMPWKRAKAMAERWRAEGADNRLFDACFRIQREASEAAGHHIPMVVENVKGAQPWVGRAKWHYGSFYLWGDVPALMPHTLRKSKNGGAGSWFDISHGAVSDGQVGHPRKAMGFEPPEGLKTVGHANIRDGHTHTRHLTNQRESDAVKQPGLSGPLWFDGGATAVGSKSGARKAASAQIAKIPFDLACHIARCFKPHAKEHVA